MSNWNCLLGQLRRLHVADPSIGSSSAPLSWSAGLALTPHGGPPDAIWRPQQPTVKKKAKGKPFGLTAAARTLNDEDVTLLTDDQAHALCCRLRWPDTGGEPVCPRCRCVRCPEMATRATGNGTASRKLFRCSECRYQFSVTTDTVWHGGKLPLRRILKAIFEFVTSPKGISATAITIKMDLDYKTSLVTNHKIRDALGAYQSKLVLEGVVEIDGVYFGASRRRPNLGRGAPVTYGSRTRERCVLTVAERHGPVVAVIVEGETKAAIRDTVRQHVRPGSLVITDELSAYDFLGLYFELNRINHSVEFARGSTSVNNAESFHARLRRAQLGVYHRFSAGRNFDLYLAELAFRHSHRQIDTRSLWEKVLRLTLQHPKSKRFAGYWQQHKSAGVRQSSERKPLAEISRARSAHQRIVSKHVGAASH